MSTRTWSAWALGLVNGVLLTMLAVLAFVWLTGCGCFCETST